MGGFPKALLEFDGEKGIERILRVCAQAGLGKSIVVLGAHAERIPREAALCHAQVVVNVAWEKGQTSSVQTGVQALEAQSSGFLIWPVDLPLVPLETVQAIVRAKGQTPNVSIFVPVYQGKRGHPVRFASALAEEILALGDRPLHNVLRRDPHRVQELPVESAAILRDFDRPEDLPRSSPC